MPVSKPAELPQGGGGRWPLCGSGFRSEQWGDMEVGHTTVDERVYPNSDWPDEVAETGDVYYFRAGHVLMYEEPSEVLELNPAAALQTLMDHVESVARQMADV
jgi:hypothetical protein